MEKIFQPKSETKSGKSKNFLERENFGIFLESENFQNLKMIESKKFENNLKV